MVITGIIDEQIIEEKYNQRYALKQWICELKQLVTNSPRVSLYALDQSAAGRMWTQEPPFSSKK
jgi:hypothetical protein